jgi:hypothetical protein
MNSVPRTRDVGPLTQVSWQLFMNEIEPLEAPEVAQVPNEITLSQLVMSYIHPNVEGKFDIDTIFRWTLEETEPPAPSGKGPRPDKSVREIVKIPQQIPVGFNLRVAANTVHLGSEEDRTLVELSFGAIRFYLGFKQRKPWRDSTTKPEQS